MGYQHKKTYNDKGEKWCGNCKTYHDKSLFGRNRASSDGLQWSCMKSCNDATNRRRMMDILRPIPSAPIDNSGDATDTAIKQLQVIYPDLKLANPYEYKRPDAYDNYIQSLNHNSVAGC